VAVDDKQMELGVVFSGAVSGALKTSIDDLLKHLSDIEVVLKSTLSSAFTSMSTNARNSIQAANTTVNTFNTSLAGVSSTARNTGTQMGTLATQTQNAVNKMNSLNTTAGGLTS
jgi:hypothetical protein